MKNKVVIGLIIVGIIFLGSATYALLNENFLSNDVTSDIQTNDTSLSNNQSNIQNNPTNIQNNQSSNIISGEKSNLKSNNMANVILNDIIDENTNNGSKTVKELGRVTVNNRTEIFYDDGSSTVIEGNKTYNFRKFLIPIYDVDSVSGGYLECTNCIKFIPVGDVSGLIPEEYICDCGAYVKSIKDVSFLYSEENVLEYIKTTQIYINTVGPIQYAIDNDSATDEIDISYASEDINQANVDTNIGSDDINQENIENTDFPSIDYSRSNLIDVPQQEHPLMNWQYTSENSQLILD